MILAVQYIKKFVGDALPRCQYKYIDDQGVQESGTYTVCAYTIVGPPFSSFCVGVGPAGLPLVGSWAARSIVARTELVISTTDVEVTVMMVSE